MPVVVLVQPLSTNMLHISVPIISPPSHYFLIRIWWWMMVIPDKILFHVFQHSSRLASCVGGGLVVVVVRGRRECNNGTATGPWGWHVVWCVWAPLLYLLWTVGAGSRRKKGSLLLLELSKLVKWCGGGQSQRQSKSWFLKLESWRQAAAAARWRRAGWRSVSAVDT